MISLRQHIFSLVAVFVALAIGIAAGSTVVRGPLLDSTRARLASAEELIEQERSENDVLAAEVAQLDDLGVDAPEQLLAGRLGAEPVLLVVAGDVDGDAVDGVARSLQVATSAFVGELRIDPAVFDPANAARVAEQIGLPELVDTTGDPTPEQADAVAATFGEQVGALLDQVAIDTAAPAPEQASGLRSTGEPSERERTAPPDTATDGSDGTTATAAENTTDETTDTTARTDEPDRTDAPGDTEPDTGTPDNGTTDTGTTDTDAPDTAPPDTAPPDTAPAPVAGRGAADALRAAFGALEDSGLVDLLRLNPAAIHGQRLGVVLLTDRNLSHDPSTVLRAMMTGPEDSAASTVWMVAEVGRIAQDNDEPTPSFVGAIRDSGRLRDEFSTVDNAETILGWIAIVLGLAAAEQGEVGQYGFRTGAEAPIPRST